MYLAFQKSLIDKLQVLADSDRHSILIEGLKGSGKTYCAKQFADRKGITTFHKVQPKVADIKAVLEQSMSLTEPHVLCIENLDTGSVNASQAILKYLEEPLSNVYIIVTCLNKSKLSSTIPSRSVCVKLDNPTEDDLYFYGKSLNSQKLEIIKKYEVYQTAKTLEDINYLLNLTLDKIQYYSNFCDNSIWNLTVDQIMWNLGHYEDGSKSSIPLALLTIFNTTDSRYVKLCCIQALQDLESSRYSETAVLGKFVIDIKCN